MQQQNTKMPTFQMALSEKEKNLIELVRSYECAHITIYVQDKIPLRVESVKESIKL